MQLKKIGIIAVFLCLIIGLYLRFYKLTTVPDMHLDEMSFAYTSYSYIKTGLDEFGKPPGIVFESLGDYKLAPFAFATMPFAAISGLEPITVRLPSALFGLGTVLCLYLLVNRLYKNKALAITSALLLLLSPWHILFSRTGNEASLQLFSIIAGMYLWALFRSTEKKKYLFLSIPLFLIGLYSYYSSFVFLPAFLLFLPLFNNRGSRIVHALPFVVISLLFLLFFLTQPTQRVGQTSFFKHGEVEALVTESHSEENGTLPLPIVRLIHNKFTVGTQLLIRNYFQHYTYNFLFLEGDPSYGRYSLPFQGPLYIWMLPFLVIGVGIASHKMIVNKQ